uniref:Secreted protein n=1 Tax=Leersia perrieri TaxID=77586 RepID=A0A0D9W2Q1_9ORYZ
MPSTVVAMAIVVVLLLLMALAPPTEMALAAAVTGEARLRPPALVPFRARFHGRRQPSFRGRAENGCMPRGHRVPPSAPSRYANYHTLDAGLCDSDHGGGSRKP